MSTDDSKPGGLFSKMVRFVRHPTRHWSELDAQADAPLGQADQQGLRQTLERKRRNDFVRQREFDQLRQLRQQEVLSARGVDALSESTTLPTNFQNSTTAPGTRAVMLQKIDAIEEQMAQQWWRSKEPADASTLPMYLLSTFPQPDSVHVATPAAVLHGAAPAGAAPAGAALQSGFALTAPLDWLVDAGNAQPPMMTFALAGEAERSVLTTTFAATEPHEPPDWGAPRRALPPIDRTAAVFVHDPAFEEAAIAFANGNALGAEASLLGLLAQRAEQPEGQQPVWQALFDLYRAAGMAERFDVLAIDFAARFERSAPLWCALSTRRGWVEPGAAQAPPGARAWRWHASAQLTRQSVAALQRAKSAATAPWTLVWTALERIDADALVPFERLINEWAQTPGQIIFLDAAVLDLRLQALTVSGEREAPEDGWRLRMAALRLMEQHDSFERVALDYCVTYEVSPPSWTQPRSSYLDALPVVPDADAPAEPLAAAGGGLAGCIENDATPWLVALESQARRDGLLVVDCSELIRLDFAAAGSVLNWSERMQARGIELRFERMHLLVAVFFGMIGVNEHAQLCPRDD